VAAPAALRDPPPTCGDRVLPALRRYGGDARRRGPLPLNRLERARVSTQRRRGTESGRGREGSQIQTRAGVLVNVDGEGRAIISTQEPTMKAVWNGVTIAESDDTVPLEGNHYFPPDSVDWDHPRAHPDALGLSLERPCALLHGQPRTGRDPQPVRAATRRDGLPAPSEGTPHPGSVLTALVVKQPSRTNRETRVSNPRRLSKISLSVHCLNPCDLGPIPGTPSRDQPRRYRPICRHLGTISGGELLIAMQKVEGSNPFSRS
jgi:nucleotidyltransferase-like protein